MAWLISDANIIIDFEVGEVLDLIFQLPEDFAVPDILYVEELSDRHSNLPALGLSILQIREEYILEAARLSGIYKHPGRNDILALALAKQESCPLITGDARLRTAAEAEMVEVRGTLWVMERLFEENILTIAAINSAYERMLQADRRLPVVEINSQLRRLRKR